MLDVFTVWHSEPKRVGMMHCISVDVGDHGMRV